MDDAYTNEINAKTAFMHGTKFASEREVRDYFTIESMLFMFGGNSDEWSAFALTGYAEYVIEHRIHCVF